MQMRRLKMSHLIWIYTVCKNLLLSPFVVKELNGKNFVYFSDRAENHCSHEIPHGHITWSCGITSNSICEYSCDEGYQKHRNISRVTCSGTWTAFSSGSLLEADELCKHEDIVQSIYEPEKGTTECCCCK